MGVELIVVVLLPRHSDVLGPAIDGVVGAVVTAAEAAGDTSPTRAAGS